MLLEVLLVNMGDTKYIGKESGVEWVRKVKGRGVCWPSWAWTQNGGLVWKEWNYVDKMELVSK
jgi:hypothetical protein